MKAKHSKFKLLLLTLLGLSALVLTGCNLEGLAAFSPTHNRVAVITNSSKLYTTNFAGGDVKVFNGDKAILATFPVTFDPFGNRLLYVNEAKRVCLADALTGGDVSCPVQLPNSAAAGFLAFLPSGEFVIFFEDGGVNRLQIYRTNGTQVRDDTADQFFLPQSAYKLKRGSNGAEWYLKPYAENSLSWVITRGDRAYLYVSSNMLQEPVQLPGIISPAVQDALSQRQLIDISSGAVSPDGRTLLFRTEQGSSYNLYALDLSAGAASFVQLVTNANFKIQFRLSPDGSQVAYESNQGGRSVWLANADGANPRQLADNASLPEWHE